MGIQLMMESEHPVRLFDYTPGRGRKYAASFLSGFTGILITEDYARYNQVDHTTRERYIGRMREGISWTRWKG